MITCLPASRCLVSACSTPCAEGDARVKGVDILDTLCGIYAERLPDWPVHRASMLDTGLPAASYDLVVVESLHHLPSEVSLPEIDAGVIEIVLLIEPGCHLPPRDPSVLTPNLGIHS